MLLGLLDCSVSIVRQGVLNETKICEDMNEIKSRKKKGAFIIQRIRKVVLHDHIILE